MTEASTFDITGWTFADSDQLEWQTMGPGVAMKALGVADGTMIALFRFEAGYVGGSHHHEEPEFTYVLEGDLVSNGVTMHAGHAYAARAGTDHEEFRTDGGALLVSVFMVPG